MKGAGEAALHLASAICCLHVPCSFLILSSLFTASAAHSIGWTDPKVSLTTLSAQRHQAVHGVLNGASQHQLRSVAPHAITSRDMMRLHFQDAEGIEREEADKLQVSGTSLLQLHAGLQTSIPTFPAKWRAHPLPVHHGGADSGVGWSSYVLGVGRHHLPIRTHHHSRTNASLSIPSMPHVPAPSQPSQQGSPLSEGTPKQWLIFSGALPLLLILDYVVMEVIPSEGIWNHLLVLGIWFCAAMLYNSIVFMESGLEEGMLWLNGLLLEGVLSLDNIFAYHMVITAVKVPLILQRKALFFGIALALVLRLGMYCSVANVLYSVAWFRFVLGAFIIFCGFQALRSDMSSDEEEEFDSGSSWTACALRSILGDRLLNAYDVETRKVVVVRDGRYQATMLLVAIVLLEAMDILFIGDSVSAKLAMIPDQYVCYSSSIFSMLITRSLYFLIRELVRACELLKYGIGIILVSIGVQLIIRPWYDIPPMVDLIFILSVITICVVTSKVLQLLGLPKKPKFKGQLKGQPLSDDSATPVNSKNVS